MRWDWNWCRTRTAGTTVARVVARIRPADIVVMHDGNVYDPGEDQRHTVEATARLIPLLRAKGYVFGTSRTRGLLRRSFFRASLRHSPCMRSAESCAREDRMNRAGLLCLAFAAALIGGCSKTQVSEETILELKARYALATEAIDGTCYLFFLPTGCRMFLNVWFATRRPWLRASVSAKRK